MWILPNYSKFNIVQSMAALNWFDNMHWRYIFLYSMVIAYHVKFACNLSIKFIISGCLVIDHLRIVTDRLLTLLRPRVLSIKNTKCSPLFPTSSWSALTIVGRVHFIFGELWGGGTFLKIIIMHNDAMHLKMNKRQ